MEDSKNYINPQKRRRYSLDNFRPISLQLTISKLYSAVIAKLLREVVSDEKLLSNNQKGFMPGLGAIEHDYLIHASIRNAKRNGTRLFICSYDLRNAFGSIEHELIEESLQQLGFDESTVRVIIDMNMDNKYWISTKMGNTNMISMDKGIRQGDPLSPLLFNLVVERLSRKLNQLPKSECGKNHVLFADDLTIIANNEDTFQQLHQQVLDFTKSANLEININKCSLLAIQGRKNRKVSNLSCKLNFNGKFVSPIDNFESYRYLGNVVGKNRNGIWKSFWNLLDDTKRILHKTANSVLGIAQKHHVIRTFITPRWEYFVRLNGLGTSYAKSLGETIRDAIRKYCNLPKQTCRAFFHASVSDGGLNIPDPWSWACASQCDNINCLLNSMDDDIVNIVKKEIYQLVQSRYHIEDIASISTDQLICSYLNGDFEDRKRRKYIDCLDPLAMAPKYFKELLVRIRFGGNNFQLFTNVDESTTQVIKSVAELKEISKRATAKRWHDADKGQGKSSPGCGAEYSNFWLNSNVLPPSVYSFSIKSRLDLLPTKNNLLKWKKSSTSMCVNCGNCETIHHILSGCPAYMSKRRDLHAKVLNRLSKTILYNNKSSTTKITFDRAISDVPGDRSRPDIVIRDDATKEIKIVDLAITSQNGKDFLQKARDQKIEKYKHIQEHFERQGYNTYLDAIVFGSMGAMDKHTIDVIKKCGSTTKYTFRMVKFITTDILRNSYQIWGMRCGSRLPSVVRLPK